MDKRIFISYKFGEGNRYRDKLISRIEQGSYKYLGETKDSSNISLMNDATVGSILSDKLFSTHVTIVLVTPNINRSNWIPWEISYSLRLINKSHRNSTRNGIVAVVVPNEDNSYDHVIKKTDDGREINIQFFPDIMKRNMFNPSRQSSYNSTDKDFGTYISVYKWDEFCSDMNDIINKAYLKAENMSHMFDIRTQI